MLNDSDQNKKRKPTLVPERGRKIILQFSASLIAIMLITAIVWLATGYDETEMNSKAQTQEKASLTPAPIITPTPIPTPALTSTPTPVLSPTQAPAISSSPPPILTSTPTPVLSPTQVPAAPSSTGNEIMPTSVSYKTSASSPDKSAISVAETHWPDGFSMHLISHDLAERMRLGGSLTEDTPVSLADLRYLQIPYYNFDGNKQTGEMIVHRLLAEEVLDIFTELYQAQFPIASMRLIDDFNADDYLSMEANNSYAFCTRPILGSSTGFSRHSYGVAIDINPVQNPYIHDGQIYPTAGEAYQDRSKIRPGMIIPGQLIHESFTSRGWTWGGSWNSLKDYHHFEKALP